MDTRTRLGWLRRRAQPTPTVEFPTNGQWTAPMLEALVATGAKHHAATDVGLRYQVWNWESEPGRDHLLDVLAYEEPTDGEWVYVLELTHQSMPGAPHPKAEALILPTETIKNDRRLAFERMAEMLNHAHNQPRLLAPVEGSNP